MRKFLILMAIFCSVGLIAAQEKPNKNKKAEFAVGGNCEMCKKRIEKAAYSIKGVKSAIWNVESGNIQVIIDERKCSVKDVQKAIAKIGHDAGEERADNKTYENLHHCCLYERLPEKK
ncbi:heavy-metal-associated domain-containing protein [Capnocytophaga cynodegmi]|uniref:heavy-metal-associated domain-containing protein n=1 Tax=Capnocytophaga cynodegmi TaxID=28189 RepID=UPI001EE1942F|nr:cation transporter [Capnocytophaga cynodegmi]GJQ06498.1 metal transporter [Capnocytophaga cynodegmi]